MEAFQDKVHVYYVYYVYYMYIDNLKGLFHSALLLYLFMVACINIYKYLHTDLTKFFVSNTSSNSCLLGLLITHVIL